jgi:hypothetical protein
MEHGNGAISRGDNSAIGKADPLSLVLCEKLRARAMRIWMAR